MSRTYSVANARAHLPEILDQVEAGDDVGLSRRGRLVAVVISSDEYETLRGTRARFAEAYKNFLGRHSLAKAGVNAEYIESLRDKTTGRRVRL
jgi:prevent-host-death family protein